jgi:hypothetical protein
VRPARARLGVCVMFVAEDRVSFLVSCGMM